MVFPILHDVYNFIHAFTNKGCSKKIQGFTYMRRREAIETFACFQKIAIFLLPKKSVQKWKRLNTKAFHDFVLAQ